MKADDRKLERLLRRILKEERLPADDVAFHWEGLGAEGDRVVIRTLNKQKGWNAFVKWAEDKPQITPRLRSIADSAGIEQEALSALSNAGVIPLGGDTPRTRALWIRDVVENEVRKEWTSARLLLAENIGILPAVLDLLEGANNRPASAAFITTILEEAVLPDAESQAVRKALYRLKQKGIEPAIAASAPSAVSTGIRELFAFGENRIARWQPILYFRTHSAFTDAGDLYVLQLEEARTFEIAEQQRDLSIDSARMTEIAAGYSANIQKRSGLRIPLRPLDPVAARYFLQRSATLLAGFSGERLLSDFLRFIGGDAINPDIDFEQYEGFRPSLEQASAILESPYFEYWMFASEEVTDLVTEFDDLERGPIVLPPQQTMERKHKAGIEWLERHLQARNRQVWALSFAKAAHFLRDSDFSAAYSAWTISKAIEDLQVPVDRIPAIGFLLDRTLKFIAREKETKQEEEKKSALIMSPQEFERSQRRR